MLRLLLLFFLQTCVYSLSYAQGVSTSGSRVCVGYNPETGMWGDVGISYANVVGGNCPRSHAFIAFSKVNGPDIPARSVPIRGSCCPLPDDVLLDSHTYALEECPDNSVATGVKSNIDSVSVGCRQKDAESRRTCREKLRKADIAMRCTKINTKRYMLGEETAGLYWSWPENISDYDDPRVHRLQIPASIRYAVGRDSRFAWSFNGCIGYPWGSLLTRKENRRCYGRFVRSLQYAGLPGDPPRGSLVSLFPDCSTVVDRFDSSTKCVPSPVRE